MGACLSLSQSWAHLARAGYCRILEKRDQPGGSALFPGHEGVMMLLASGYTQGLPPPGGNTGNTGASRRCFAGSRAPSGPGVWRRHGSAGQMLGGWSSWHTRWRAGAAGACRSPRRQWGKFGACSSPVPAAQAAAPETGLANLAAAGRAAEGGSATTATRCWLGPFSGIGGAVPSKTDTVPGHF